MAVIVDWMLNAANEIADALYVPTLYVPYYAATIQAIIAKHSPLQPDVAYMPVPRCETCVWWLQPKSGHVRGECARLVDSSGLTHGSKAVATTGGPGFFFATLHTDADFGCVQWKEKG